jgi:hypothetical protein
VNVLRNLQQEEEDHGKAAKIVCGRLAGKHGCRKGRRKLKSPADQDISRTNRRFGQPPRSLYQKERRPACFGRRGVLPPSPGRTPRSGYDSGSPGFMPIRTKRRDQQSGCWSLQCDGRSGLPSILGGGDEQSGCASPPKSDRSGPSPFSVPIGLQPLCHLPPIASG